MKLQYLHNINEFDEHAVRLSDFNSAQADAFRQVVEELVTGKPDFINLSDLEFIEEINCSLLLRISEEDTGITTRDGKDFFCDLTAEGYKDMIRLIEPFCKKESQSYQWLYELDVPIGFLFSAGEK